MTTMTAGAARWTCERCQVSVGRIDGERVAMPASWSQSEEGLHCLACSRALAAEAATERAPADTTPEIRARLRRKALIEFEIGRDPEAPDRTIANACRTSTAAVAAVREKID